MENFRKYDIEVNKDKPFENDRLDRKEQIENLTNLLNNIEDEFVLCINGTWGSGKTTFIKMWQCYLENKGYNTLYFNAWENDFAEEPLIPIINEITGVINSGKENGVSKEKIIKISKELFKVIAPAALKIATAGILDLEKINNATSEGIRDAITNATNDFIDERFKEHEKTKDVIKKFKEQLSEYITEKIAKEDGNRQEDEENEGTEQSVKSIKNKLIFFIDELDRCKPTFAVSLLERIKHVFGIKEVIYVMSIDKEQLGKTLSCIYGNGFNVDGYFARFFDLEYMLPDKSSEYFDYLQNDVEIFNEYRINEHSSLIKYFIKLPLRQMQKWIKQLGLSLNMLKKSDMEEGGAFLIEVLMIAKVIDKEFYKKVLNDLYDDDDVLTFVRDNFDSIIENTLQEEILPFFTIGLFSGILQNILLTDGAYKNKIKEIKDKHNSKNGDISNEKRYIDGMLNFMTHRDYLQNNKRFLKRILNKIELTDNFALQ